MTKREELIAKIDELKQQIDTINEQGRKESEKRFKACVKACRKEGLHTCFKTTRDRIDAGTLSVEITRMFRYDRFGKEISPEVLAQPNWNSARVKADRLAKREEKKMVFAFRRIDTIIAEHGLRDRAVEVYEALDPESGG